MPGRPITTRRAAWATFVPLLLAAGVVGAETPLPRPAQGRSVYDVGEVIPPETEAAMEALHAELRQKANVAIVVVTVPRLEGETIDELAVRAGHSWGVGQ